MTYDKDLVKELGRKSTVRLDLGSKFDEVSGDHDAVKEIRVSEIPIDTMMRTPIGDDESVEKDEDDRSDASSRKSHSSSFDVEAFQTEEKSPITTVPQVKICL